jgi:23S rRNA (cytidine1920-2'-O)/16S rRNA (cytidine1409-2'-O)-methyltransferase
VKKVRIDQLLVQKGHFLSREQAQRAMMAGLVWVDQQRMDKAGTQVSPDVSIEVKSLPHPYVSRGGLKLEEALHVFQLDITGKVMVDIGASTGGFTDCALQHGVKQVYAIDVGYGQLAWKLRQDPRVIVMERTNFRHLQSTQWEGEKPDLATIDVSFISLAHILPPLTKILCPGGIIVALIKPQFEAGRAQVGKKGIVKDPAVHRQVLYHFVQFVTSLGFHVKGFTVSPIRGGTGNIEFLAYLIYREGQNKDWTSDIVDLVQMAHDRL